MRNKHFLRRTGQIIGRILRILVLILVAVPLIGNIYIAAAKNIFGQKNPTFFGFAASVVLTGSMSGSIEPNDIIVTRRQSSYTVGDIITFDYSGSASVTHRIIAADAKGYHTKGDANNTADSLPVGQEAIIGKVVLIIPKIGALLGFVQTPLGALCFLGLTALVVELPVIVNCFKKHKDKQQIQKGDGE